MRIMLVNHSTSLPSDEVLARIAAAIAIQVARDLAPAWSRSPISVSVGSPSDAEPSPVTAPVVIFDDADQAGALGYHDRDPHGRPYARVFASPVLDHGGDWATKPLSVASVISHEVLELVADPGVNLWADDGHSGLYALEVADPVESGSYAIDHVTVSNFVLPSWFDPGAPPPYDHLGEVHAPFELDDAGYAIVATEGDVREVFGETSIRPPWRSATKDHPASRTALRLAHGGARGWLRRLV